MKKSKDVKIVRKPDTICNPINISYQYQSDFPARESADPCVIVYKNEYFLFASHGSGYWWSEDLAEWHFVYCEMEEINFYAPAACVIGDTIYLTHSGEGAIYKSDDPKSGKWEYVSRPVLWGDPALLADDDGRVYCYYGCTCTEPIYAVELDPKNDMALLRGPVPVIYENRNEHGFEVPGEDHRDYEGECWLEGAWMTKYHGKYYLQYAAPGTQYKSYADGCYVSGDPMGPFTYCDNSPVSYKATGFLPGAGHGSLLQDIRGDWWKFDTVNISVNHMFERRIAMFPAKFNYFGQLVINMAYADYPMYYPNSSKYSFEESRPEWSLISYNAEAEASTSFGIHEPALAFNEDIRTWWSAETGDAGEWIKADLKKVCTLFAFQINFADQDAVSAPGRDNSFSYRYLVEGSEDNNVWFTLADKSEAVGRPYMAEDTSHHYYDLGEPMNIRYIRVTNKGEVPAGGKFAISGIRLFGSGGSRRPKEVGSLEAVRDAADERAVYLNWESVEGAEGYVINFGAHANGLTSHYQVIGKTSAEIRCLNKGVKYYFTIDAYNDSGIRKWSKMAVEA